MTRETVNRISRRQTLDDNDDVDGTPGSPEANKPDNNRPTKPEPTQEEIERGELRTAVGMIMVLPYPGEGTLKLELTEDDVANLEAVSTWAAAAVIAYRSQRNDFDD